MYIFFFELTEIKNCPVYFKIMKINKYILIYYILNDYLFTSYHSCYNNKVKFINYLIKKSKRKLK